MRVKVDYDLCQGHEVCMSEAPEVFEVDKQTAQVVLLDAQPSDALRVAVEAAVKYCPTGALSIEDD